MLIVGILNHHAHSTRGARRARRCASHHQRASPDASRTCQARGRLAMRKEYALGASRPNPYAKRLGDRGRAVLEQRYFDRRATCASTRTWRERSPMRTASTRRCGWSFVYARSARPRDARRGGRRCDHRREHGDRNPRQRRPGRTLAGPGLAQVRRRSSRASPHRRRTMRACAWSRRPSSSCSRSAPGKPRPPGRLGGATPLADLPRRGREPQPEAPRPRRAREPEVLRKRNVLAPPGYLDLRQLRRGE